jgi:hypothetical protein
LYFLVYVGVLRDDKPVQLAYENRIIPLPDVWWQSDADTNADSDADTDTHSNANPDAYTNSDTDAHANACACAECAEQFVWKCCFHDSDQSVVDG